jgi:tripartite ATP-independent transporter DctP family solute receptor
MKRFFVLFGILAVLGLAANGFAQKINIDVNNTMKPGGSEEAAINKFKEIVEKKSDGRMNVKIFMSGQLGGEDAVLELLKIGQTQISLTGGNYRHICAPQYNVAEIPFYLSNWDIVKGYLEGPIGQKIAALAAEKGGLVDFGPQKRAPREMTSNRPIRKPEDIKGLKMRLPSVPTWLSVWKELGALPTIIPAPEIYLAMKTGQVEAHENTLVSPYSRKMWEVQKYIIMTDHVYWPWQWVGSKAWFDKLSAEDQKIIRDAIEEAREYGAQVEDEKDQFYVVELKKNGMEFITPDNQAIRAKAMPAIEKALKELDPEVSKEVDRLTKKFAK